MRDVSMLRELNDVHTLLTFLYFDEKNSVRVENAVGTKLELTMDDEGYIHARVLELAAGGPPSCDKPFLYDELLSVPILLGVIEQLQEQPPVMKNVKLKSRWDEIKVLTSTVRVLNSSKRPRQAAI